MQRHIRNRLQHIVLCCWDRDARKRSLHLRHNRSSRRCVPSYKHWVRRRRQPSDFDDSLVRSIQAEVCSEIEWVEVYVVRATRTLARLWGTFLQEGSNRARPRIKRARNTCEVPRCEDLILPYSVYYSPVVRYSGLADKSKSNFITLYIYFCGIWPVLGCIDADLCK